MKLSYQNIGILQNLFEGVEVIYEHCNCEPGYCRNCEPWVSKIRIGEVSFKARETHIEATNTGHKYGGLTFTDTTTVSDFQKLCAHLGVELVEKEPKGRYATPSDFFGNHKICVNCGKALIDHPLPGLVCPDTPIRLLP